MEEIQLKEINEAVRCSPERCISEADFEYMRSVFSVADSLEASDANIVLLAGPSGSGKTTTANILRDHLAEKGHETVIVSLDDFYRNKDDPSYPRDEAGELDYESVHALHTDKLRDSIARLLAGDDVVIPKYVFKKGASHYDNEPIRLKKGGFVIMEGLHALNPIIVDGIDKSRIMKMFISVSTNINDGNECILSGRKFRFIRRMTRDSIYRGSTADSTLNRWQSVIEGENEYLYPFKDTADFRINTFHKYELGVMKPFAEKAINDAGETMTGEYIGIVKNALDRIEPLPISILPETSLIREFVPGGKYDALY